MESSSDEGSVKPVPQAQPEPDVKATKKKKRFSVAFKGVFDKTSRSKAPLHSPPRTAPLGSETVADDSPTERNALVRSRSEDFGPRVKEKWAEQIWDQDSLKQSVISLQSSVSEYEKEATLQQWTDLFKISSDVTELERLAEFSDTKNSKKAADPKSVDGLTKFTTVALEYSKMLDVVMNQSPEYAALVWGVSGCPYPFLNPGTHIARRSECYSSRTPTTASLSKPSNTILSSSAKTSGSPTN